MNRINKIINHKKYIEYMDLNKLYEIERIFCHHDIVHLLDVSRIAYILNLESDYGIKKEIIYACGLLHDIGRWKQYEQGLDHADVSSELAYEILVECEFSKEEIYLIQRAIKFHRVKEHPDQLSKIIYNADKLSRYCYDCHGKQQCKRFKDNKDFFLEY